MSPLEVALAQANTQIADFLTGNRPALDLLRQALAQVAPFLPCTNPSPPQRLALQQYRQNLEALQSGTQRLKDRLTSRRVTVLTKLKSVKAARAYQASTQF